MPYDLTNNKISETYGRVVQIVSGSYYDGFGNVLPIGTSSVVVTASTAQFATTGSNTFIGNEIVSGSVIVTNGITGSLYGTSSYSLNAISSSYSSTASYWSGSVISASYSNTSSYSSNSNSSSYALTASYALNTFSLTTGSTYPITSSWAENSINTINAQNAQDILVYVKNTSGAIITKGHLVRIVDADNSSNNPTIELADFRNENKSANTLGYTNEDFSINGFGYVITEGKLIGVNTANFTSGDLLYLSSSGDYTNVKPIPPNHGVRVGQVIRSQINNGSIYVTVDNGAELDELHNVIDTSTTSSYGDLLIKSGSVWINSKNLTGSYTLSGSFSITNGITSSLYGTSSWSTNTINVNGGYVTASGILTSGNIIPGNIGVKLGTVEFPFESISISSGSLIIANENPLIPAAVLSNNLGNLDISSGGIRLIQPNSSFIAPTASFSYLSSSFIQVGDRTLIGNDIISGSSTFTGVITSSGIYITPDGNGRLYGTASYALNGGTLLVTGSTYQITSSWANNVVSSSYALTASYVVIAQTASYWSGSVVSSSYSDSSSYSNNSNSSSYAVTASYSLISETSNNAQNAQDILIYAKNTSGAIIPKGKVVRIVGADNSSNSPTIELADFRNEFNSANTLGFTNESFGINGFGYVMTEGKLTTVNTSDFSSGNLLYLSSSGTVTTTIPFPPNHGVRLGQVIRSQNVNGSIYVRIDNGFNLGELHNVLDNSTTSSYGDLLVKSGSVWRNSKNLTGSYTLSGSLVTNDGVTCTSLTSSNQLISSYLILSQVSSSLNFSNDASASVGGVPLGGLYRNGNVIQIRLV